MFGSLGLPELIFIFVLALLIFGPKRLPQVGRTVGRGLAEFRKASTDLRRTINAELIDDELRSADPRKIVRDSLRQAKQGLDDTLNPKAAAGRSESVKQSSQTPAPGSESAAQPKVSTADEPPAPVAAGPEQENVVSAPGAVARGSNEPPAGSMGLEDSDSEDPDVEGDNQPRDVSS